MSEALTLLGPGLVSQRLPTLTQHQLGGLVALPGGQEILQEHAVGRKAQENNGEGSRTLGGGGQSAESSHSFPSMSTWMTAWTPGPTLSERFVREGRVRAHGLRELKENSVKFLLY